MYTKVHASILQTFAYSYVWIKVVVTFSLYSILINLKLKLKYLIVPFKNVEIQAHSFKQNKLFEFISAFLAKYLISHKELN